MCNQAPRFLALLVFTVFALATGTADAQTNGDPETASKAVTKDIVNAIEKELKRASEKMLLPGQPAPHFIGIKVTEVEVRDAVASLGALSAQRDRHFLSIEARVHAGTPTLDNSNFIVAGREEIDGVATTTLPVEVSPALARRRTWLVIDAAYREAIEQLTEKKKALASGAAARQGVPSYSPVEPVKNLKPALVPKLAKMDTLKDRARALSENFRSYKHIRDSRASITSFLERRWYLNTDGTRATDTRRVAGVILVASAQAEDGQGLNLYYSRYGQTAADLPSDKSLAKEAGKLAKRLEALRKAPRVDPYSGPVLFEGEAASDVVRYGLANHLAGTPLPIGLAATNNSILGGGLATRMGQRVAHASLDFVDDPRKKWVGKRYLIGGYELDDEGVSAQRVSVIEKGSLKQLLQSRVPAKAGQASNGHARLSALGAGGIFRGSTTNLFVSAKGGSTRNAMKKKLISQVKKMGLPYGILIRQFEDHAITANSELSQLTMFVLLRTHDSNAPPLATQAYRVYPDGKEELVRGVQLETIDSRAWKYVLAASRERNIKNYLKSTDDPKLTMILGKQEGFVPSAGVESAVVSPDLLFEELDVKTNTYGVRAEPVVPRP